MKPASNLQFFTVNIPRKMNFFLNNIWICHDEYGYDFILRHKRNPQSIRNKHSGRKSNPTANMAASTFEKFRFTVSSRSNLSTPRSDDKRHYELIKISFRRIAVWRERSRKTRNPLPSKVGGGWGRVESHPKA